MDIQMTRILVGFFFGLMAAGALAQTTSTPGLLLHDGGVRATLNAGVDPDGRMAKILVDKNGYVICSTERPS
jgi:hypothetical protein